MIPTCLDITNLEIPFPKEDLIAEIDALDEKWWFYVKFHGGWITSLYNAREDGTGGWHPKGFNPDLPQDGACVRALRDHVFPYMGSAGNITIIRTPPEASLNDHLDSTPEEMGTYLPKFRWVLKGKLNTMHFFDNNNNKVNWEPIGDKYIVNGAHPHGMANSGDDTKLTMCMGYPWLDNATFQENTKDLTGMSINFPNTVLDGWTDKRFKTGKVGLGDTEVQ
jgi:hypothetical protein|tara:strand:- start:8949 stop:9614 length:666 start_codon:yes stop_codon:yes gene_type:complete